MFPVSAASALTVHPNELIVLAITTVVLVVLFTIIVLRDTPRS